MKGSKRRSAGKNAVSKFSSEAKLHHPMPDDEVEVVVNVPYLFDGRKTKYVNAFQKPTSRNDKIRSEQVLEDCENSVCEGAMQISCRVLGLKSVKDYFLKKEDGLKHTMESSVPGEKFLLFNPEVLNSPEDAEKAGVSNENLRRKILEDMKNILGDQAPTDFFHMERSISYEHSFSQVGHIAHLNLREDLLPYKFIIGEIIHDKISWAKTVVNKLDIISNEFRFFDMELLAGEPNYVTEMTEKGVKYRMDFSKVFWNSRLSDVHESIVKQFNHRSVVFDVFCGIGPFVLPAIKNQKIKKAFANDLNPVSVQYLNENIALNKVSKDRISAYIMDGADFIRNVIAEEFSKIAVEGDFEEGVTGSNFHVVMNLPSLSVSFLPCFRGFLSRHPHSKLLFKSSPIFIHCHFFVTALRDSEPKEWFAAEAVRLIKEAVQLNHLQIQDVRYLRQVAGYHRIVIDHPAHIRFRFFDINMALLSNKSVFLRMPALTTILDSRRSFQEGPLPKLRRKVVELTVTQYKQDRVMRLGPELSCLEWLMKCGATSVIMSDGTEICSGKQMSNFINSYGLDLKKKIELPETEIVKKYNLSVGSFSSTDTDSDLLYSERWKHAPPIFIDEVDASDSMNSCDYFGDEAIKKLAASRLSRTLLDLEIGINPMMTDACALWLVEIQSLKRLHLFQLPNVLNRKNVIRQLKTSLPRCRISFPLVNMIGLLHQEHLKDS
uniref:tRNA (guanine(37)-N1)-methyltransferase n=1 Tax=Ditylenchus dipsaci TaxID=166011 RepID=A0A915CRA7_9BILA